MRVLDYLALVDATVLLSWWQLGFAIATGVGTVVVAVWKLASKSNEVTDKLAELKAQQDKRTEQVEDLTKSTTAQFDELRRGQTELLEVIHKQQSEFVQTMNKFDGRLIRIETLANVSASRMPPQGGE